MKNYLILFVLFVIFTTSCKKVEIPPADLHVYLPMKTGNYWVYKNYRIDSLGNPNELQRIDSLCITGDTIIGAYPFYIFKFYYIYSENNMQLGSVEYIRDSVGCLVNHQGKLLFTQYNFSDVFRLKPIILNGVDTIGNIQFRMKRLSEPVSVPAGTFQDVLSVEGKVLTNPELDLPPNRTIEKKYAPEVGAIYESWYYLSSPVKYDKRLLRYYVQL